MYRTSNQLQKHEKLSQTHDFCNFKLPSEEKIHISSTPGKNTLKILFIIYAELECLLIKTSSCENTDIKLFREENEVHVPCRYSIVTCYSFDKSLNEQKYYKTDDHI